LVNFPVTGEEIVRPEDNFAPNIGYLNW